MIDVPASVLKHPAFDDAIASYRKIGYLISVNDFGVDNTDVDSIAHVLPSVVKMGRAVAMQAMKDDHSREGLPLAVSLLHEMGTLVMMEGVESEEQAMLAIDADADFASGFFFGPHVDDVSEFGQPHELLNKLWTRYKKRDAGGRKQSGERGSLDNGSLHSSKAKDVRKPSSADIARYREQRRPYLTALQNIAARVRAGAILEISCDPFLKLEGAIRCFMLDASGNLASIDVHSAQPPARRGVDFYTLSAHHESDWSRRDFFRRAVNEPEVVQATRQYCSLTGYLHCVTFSMATKNVSGKLVVICGDVDWSIHAQSH